MIQIITGSIQNIASRFSSILLQELNQCTQSKYTVNMGLCWWRSIASFYQKMSCTIPTKILESIRLFPTDEKYVHQQELNFTCISASLDLKKFRQENIFLNRTGNSIHTLNTILWNDRIDIGVFWVGEDGHIAGLFTNDMLDTNDMSFGYRTVRNSPKPPQERITLTSITIQHIPVIFLLFIWCEKHDAYQKFMHWENMPASICRTAQRLYMFTDYE